jgi:hypothetical protein
MVLKFIAVTLFSFLSFTLLLAVLRKQRYPEKSFFFCLLNVILSPMRMFKLGPYKQGELTLEKAMKYASKRTKLHDFGDLSFSHSYNAIINTETHRQLKLTNIGYLVYQIELNQTMVRRLKFIQYLKDCPQVLQIPIRSPVFVLGLPRTGTTFLHQLLSLDPSVRAPKLWELLASVPKIRGDYKSNPEGFQKDCNWRAKAIRKLIDQRNMMGDNSLQHIHEIGADLPEECHLALTDELPIHLSCLYTDYLNYELFLRENSGQRVVDAYTYYRKLLQLLSFQVGETENPRRWVLKCPIHIVYIKEIGKVFPDAKIIW